MVVLCAGIIELAEQIVTWVSLELETRRDELANLEQAAALEPVTAFASPASAPKKREYALCSLCNSLNLDQLLL